MLSDEERTVVYSNTYKLRLGFREALSQLLSDVRHFRAMIWEYVRRDFVASYRGTLLGFLWKVILPLVPVSVYIFLHLVGVFRFGTGMPRALYVVAGMTFWMLWSDTLSTTLNRLHSQAGTVKKLKIPLIVIYLTGVGQILFDTIVRMLLLLALLIIFRIPFTWTWLMLPILLLPLFVFGFGLGVILSFFAVFTRDVNNVVLIVLRYGLFVSAVIFPLPTKGIVGAVIRFNPMYHLVEGTRHFVVHGYMENLNAYLLCVVVSVCICLFAIKRVCSMEERLVWAL